jgi:hypothetical protein
MMAVPVSTIAEAAFATSVADDIAIPICAWCNVGASLAPSPHIPNHLGVAPECVYQLIFFLGNNVSKCAESIGADLVKKAFGRTDSIRQAGWGWSQPRWNLRVEASNSFEAVQTDWLLIFIPRPLAVVMLTKAVLVIPFAWPQNPSYAQVGVNPHVDRHFDSGGAGPIDERRGLILGIRPLGERRFRHPCCAYSVLTMDSNLSTTLE